MITVPAFFTFDKGILRSPATYLVPFLIFTIFVSLSALSVELPRPIGLLNDYGNILSMNDREELNRLLGELKSAGVPLTILVSTRDPFSNPDRYATEIGRKWDISRGTEESFLLFLQEGDRWVERQYLTPSALDLLRNNDKLDEFRNRLQESTSEGQVREALIESVKTLHQLSTGKISSPSSNETSARLPLKPVHFIILGSCLVAVLLGGLLIRWELGHRCPECGERLQTTTQIPYPTADYITKTKSCPYCGFTETKRLET